MIAWPWLIAAFACGGIGSLVAGAAWLTKGLNGENIYAWKAIYDWAINHPDEVEVRANLLSGGIAFPSKSHTAGLWSRELGSDGARLAILGEQARIRRNEEPRGVAPPSTPRRNAQPALKCRCGRFMQRSSMNGHDGWLCGSGCGAFTRATEDSR